MTTGDNTPVPDFLSRLRVDGRTFVVAGAGVGMGRMTSHALVQAGAKTVVCVDVDADRAAEIAAEIGPAGVAWVGDVTTREGAARLAADAEAINGRIFVTRFCCRKPLVDSCRSPVAARWCSLPR